MSRRVFDFLSSFGMMILGVVLLLIGSVSFTAVPMQRLVARLPLSHPRYLSVRDSTIPSSLPLVSRPALPRLKDAAIFSAPLSATVALVVDDQTNTILFKKNPTEVRSLASISKLMSALVLRDLPIEWSATTVVAEADIDSSSHHINAGEEYSLSNLWDIALVGSSNSAIHTLVRASGLSEIDFVARMNTKAQELGLLSLRFVEPTGLDNRNMGTAIDVVRLLQTALLNKSIYQALQLGAYDAKPLNSKAKRKVWTTNWLLTNWVPNTFNKNVIVGKTGYISDSGYNFTVRLADKKSHVVRVAVLGAVSNEARFIEARDLATWVFAHYSWPGDDGYQVVAAQ